MESTAVTKMLFGRNKGNRHELFMECFTKNKMIQNVYKYKKVKDKIGIKYNAAASKL